jgi:hypothetical protein
MQQLTHSRQPPGATLPLYVDLGSTLTPSDTLYESVF